MAYWLFKTEPQTFSIDDLHQAPRQTTVWEGVRNYQARNMLRDQCRVGDQVLFYHSSCAQPGVAGIAAITRAGYADPTQFMPDSPYYDAKNTRGSPRWYVVDIKLLQRFTRILPLATLRRYPALQTLRILQRGNRLSITPVTAREWHTIERILHEEKYV